MTLSHVHRVFFLAGVVFSLSLVFFPDCVWGAQGSAGILDDVVKEFEKAASDWGKTILVYAKGLFFGIAIIYLVYSSAMVLMNSAGPGSDFMHFFAHLIRISIFFGFFYFLLENGPYIAGTILESMIQIGNEATKSNASSPSSIMDVGLNVFSRIVKSVSFFSTDIGIAIINSLIGLMILLIFALIAANLFIEYCTAWVLLYAGCFFLGFGATSWTSDMAINYFKAVLGAGVRLMSMILILGVGVSIINTSVASMAANPTINDCAVLLITGIVIFAIMNKVPSLLSNMVGGGSGVSSLGLGAIMGVAGLGAGAAMMGASAAGAVGGLAPNQSSVREAITNSMRGMSESSSAPPASSINSPTEGQSAGTPLSNAMGLDNKNAAPADPKTKGGASGSFSGGKGAMDYMTQGTRELGADLEKGGG